MSFEERLKQARTQAGLSVAQAAHLANIDPVKLGACEIGKAQLTAPEVRLLCTIYGVAEKWLVSGTPTVVSLPTTMSEVDADALRGLLQTLPGVRDELVVDTIKARLIGQLDKQRLIIAFLMGHFPEDKQAELAHRMDFSPADYASDARPWWSYTVHEVMTDYHEGKVALYTAAAFFGVDRADFITRYYKWASAMGITLQDYGDDAF